MGLTSVELLLASRTRKGCAVQMHRITSESVNAVGYDATTRTLRVEYEDGGLYDYFDVDPSLHEKLLEPHPWRRVGTIVKSHAWRKVA